MNKTKMILAGTGGAVGLVVLVLAFLVWQGFSAKTAAIEGDDEEGVPGLETVEAQAQGLSRKPIYPCAASVKAIDENQRAVDDWCKEGLSLAARGDRVFEKTTAPKFKEFLVADARRIAGLPGAAEGRLVKPDFAFGPFKEYIAEGKMPAEAELADLQRKWDDVAMIAEMLATNGVAEFLDVQLKAAAPEAAEDTGNRRGKRDKRKNAPVAPAARVAPVAFSYVFTFAARPPAFIRVLNDLEACERFVVVDDFSFVRPGDAIAAALGGDEKKAETQAAGGRRGRRGRRGEAASSPFQDQMKAEDKGGIVTDPLLDAPLTVTLTVTVHDFRSLEEGKKPEEDK